MANMLISLAPHLANELVSRCQAVTTEIKALEKQVEALNGQLAAGQIDGLMSDAIEINGVKIITSLFKDTSADVLRTMGDKVKDKDSDIIAVFASDSSILCV